MTRSRNTSKKKEKQTFVACTTAVQVVGELDGLFDLVPDSPTTLPKVSVVLPGLKHVCDTLKNGPSFFLGSKASHSQAQVKDLTPVNLPDMVVGSPHTGRYLLCRIVSLLHGPPIKCVVIDPSGSGIHLELTHYPILPPSLPKPSPQDVSYALPIGTFLLIKEPLISRVKDSIPTVRVDSPTDILILEEQDERIPEVWHGIEKDGIITELGVKKWLLPLVPLRSLEEWVEAGGEFTRRGSYLGALWAYTNAIKQHPSHAKIAEVYIHRSNVLLSLERYHAAIDDSNAALDISSTANSSTDQAILLRCRAYYALRDWSSASTALKSLSTEALQSPETRELTASINSRLEEARTGTYDFTTLFNMAVSDTKLRVDVADYTSAIKVGSRLDVGGGRGLFTTRDLRKGSVVVAVKALHAVYPRECKMKAAAASIDDYGVRQAQKEMLLTGVIYKLLHQPGLVPQVEGLYCPAVKDPPPMDYPLAPMRQGVSAINTQLISQQIDTNHDQESRATYEGVQQEDDQVMTIFPIIPLINHSCYPNVSTCLYGDFCIILTLMDLPKGTEIVRPYNQADGGDFQVGEGYLQRERNAIRMFKTVCRCEWCESDRKIPLRMHLARSRAMKAITDDIGVIGRTGLRLKSMQTKVEKHIKVVADNYPTNYRYPRVELAFAYSSLSFILGLQIKDTADLHRPIEVCEKALTCLGVDVEIKPATGFLPAIRVDHRLACELAYRLFPLTVVTCGKDMAKPIKWLCVGALIHQDWCGGDVMLWRRRSAAVLKTEVDRIVGAEKGESLLGITEEMGLIGKK